MKLPQKTTILGILAIASVILKAATAITQGMDIDWLTTISEVGAGWGLIHATDFKKQ